MKMNAFIPSIMFAIVLSSCGMTDNTSDTTSGTNTTSSQQTGRLGVAEMMATLEEGNYTLSMLTNGEVNILYQYDLPLIYLEITGEENDLSTSFYLDITNEQAPIIYFENGQGGWMGMPSDPVSLEFLTIPTSLFDPSVLESEWFVWNNEENAYILDNSYFTTMFGSEGDIEGLQEVRVTLDGQGGFTFSLTGEDPENPGVNQSFALVYANIGTTVVTLPEGIEDFISVFLNDVLANSMNHTYFLNQYEVTEDLENPLLLIGSLWGSRDGQAISIMDSNYDSEGNFESFVTNYYAQTNEGYVEFIVDFVNVTENQITQAAYEIALANFYPFDVFAIEESWIDKNEINYDTEGFPMYGIKPNYIATLVGDTLPVGATNIKAYAAFITFEESSNLLLNVEYTFQDKAYKLEFIMTSFGYTSVMLPVI